MKRKFSVILFVLLLGGSVIGASVGAVPGSIEYSDVAPGTTIEGELYLTTNVDYSFNASPSASSLTNQAAVLDSNRPSIVSQEGSAGWFEFSQATVDPNRRKSVRLPDGSSAKAAGTSNYVIQVPDDAEPGLHRGVIEPNADITGEGNRPGAITFGETRVSYSILVNGGASRDIYVEDVRAFRLGEDQAAVELLLSNRGTVTTSTEDFKIDIIDSGRENQVTLEANGAMIEPGGSQWVEASWTNEDGIEEGSYQIEGEVDYLSGRAAASGSVSLPGFNVVEVRPESSPGSTQGQKESIPIWLVAMVLAILTVLMWSFDIEPFWILAIVGGLAIASFILLTGVSNYLLVVLLMAVGIFVYGVM